MNKIQSNEAKDMMPQPPTIEVGEYNKILLNTHLRTFVWLPSKSQLHASLALTALYFSTYIVTIYIVAFSKYRFMCATERCKQAYSETFQKVVNNSSG